MNWLTLIWSISLGASLTLGFLHGLVWVMSGRSRLAHLAFVLPALAVAGIAVGELLCMAAPTPAEFGRIQKWLHIPLLVLFAGIVGFIFLYFGTGRRWLGWTTLGVRCVVLVLNFLEPVNIHYREIGSLQKVPFLGHTVSTAGETVANPWRWLPVFSSLLLVVFVADASLRLWRRGGMESRRRALSIGGSIIAFVVLASGHTLMVHAGVVHSPYLISFFFLAIILAMTSELSGDVIAAARLTGELEESRDQMTLAARAAQLALWTWDIPRNRIWVTHDGRALYGVPPDEEIPVERFLATVHPEDRDPVRHSLEMALTGDGDFSHDYRIVLPDGKIRWISAVGRVEIEQGGRPVRLRGVSIDVTGRRDAEELSRLMVEAAPYAMLTADSAGRIVLANRQVESVFGYDRQELVGQPVGVLIPERLRAVHAGNVRGFVADPAVRQMGLGREVVGRRRDGTEFVAEVGLSPVHTDGRDLVLASILDVTERRRSEREMAEQRSELAHLSRVSTLGQLSGALAHELNQPLSIILSNAQAAQRQLDAGPPDVQELKEILADIVDEDRRAGEVIRRLRSLLKRGEMRLVSVSVNDVVRDVCRLIQSDLLARGMAIRLSLFEDVPLVSGDPVQLQQVLLNLILNGCDAMTENGSGDREIEVTTSSQAESIRISVTDHGCGLPEGDPEQVFRPFFTTKEQGLGIGLAICRSIVEAHHGRLWAERHEAGLGTRFHLELPVVSPISPG
jgi:PAS domain S-box-containing protein